MNKRQHTRTHSNVSKKLIPKWKETLTHTRSAFGVRHPTNRIISQYSVFVVFLCTFLPRFRWKKWRWAQENDEETHSHTQTHSFRISNFWETKKWKQKKIVHMCTEFIYFLILTIAAAIISRYYILILILIDINMLHTSNIYIIYCRVHTIL